jgi:predicted transcriptional regulator of viral defense system
MELRRGLYRVADAVEEEQSGIAVVAALAPNAVLCLISALSYHGITTQIPSTVQLAVPRGRNHVIKLSILVTVYRVDSKTSRLKGVVVSVNCSRLDET